MQKLIKFITCANQGILSLKEIEEIEKAVSVTADMHLAAIIMPEGSQAMVTAKVHEVALAGNKCISYNSYNKWSVFT